MAAVGAGYPADYGVMLLDLIAVCASKEGAGEWMLAVVIVCASGRK